MRTEVEMKRELFGYEIGQLSKCEMLSGTDLVAAGNKWRAKNELTPFNMTNWLDNKSTVEFMDELKLKFGDEIVKKTGRGRGAKTWLHPLLFIDMALAISPRLKVETYSWLFDHLLKNRNDSGDSYKKMCGCLYVRIGRKADFPSYIQRVANNIQAACGIRDHASWQKATEQQLAKRDKIHSEIALLADVLNDNNTAIRITLERNGFLNDF